MFIVSLFILFLITQGSHIDSFLDRAKADTKENKGKIWAVLVAGSSGWWNYRHQSDVCHLYKLLTKNHGIPRAQVIVMMYNDIAFNEQNKHPGTIINALHGKDVYEGTMIDYMGEDVTPNNFLKILRGESMDVGSRNTLRSGPRDHVFVNFVDHGDTGILGFPSDELHLVDLNRTLQRMHENGKYSQMLWYVEACFSGSMFEGLSSTWNMTAHTAANSEESSFACVWDDEIGSFLGDCWSLNWMNNTEQIYPRLYKETVGQQYKIVKEMTTQSHASIFGDLQNIYNDKLSVFFGHPLANEVESEPMYPILSPARDPTPTPDVMLETLRRRRDRLNEDVKEEIRYHENKEKEVQVTLKKIVAAVTGSEEEVAASRRQPIKNSQCNKDVLSTFYKECFKFQSHPYITKYTYWLSNLCNSHNSKRIVEQVKRSCTKFLA